MILHQVNVVKHWKQRWGYVGKMLTDFLMYVTGSLGHSVTDTSTLLAGASGGVYALIGAHIAIVVMVSFNIYIYIP